LDTGGGGGSPSLALYGDTQSVGGQDGDRPEGMSPALEKWLASTGRMVGSSKWRRLVRRTAGSCWDRGGAPRRCSGGCWLAGEGGGVRWLVSSEQQPAWLTVDGESAARDSTVLGAQSVIGGSAVACDEQRRCTLELGPTGKSRWGALEWARAMVCAALAIKTEGVMMVGDRRMWATMPVAVSFRYLGVARRTPRTPLVLTLWCWSTLSLESPAATGILRLVIA
jgi:hypothetical protein